MKLQCNHKRLENDFLGQNVISMIKYQSILQPRWLILEEAKSRICKLDVVFRNLPDPNIRNTHIKYMKIWFI